MVGKVLRRQKFLAAIKHSGLIQNPQLAAMDLCEELAKSGNKNAKYNLPRMYRLYGDRLFYGKEGLSRNLDEAIHYFKKAAALVIDNEERGLFENKDQFASQFYQYGLVLGKGCEINLDAACIFFEQAVLLGDIEGKRAEKDLAYVRKKYYGV